MTNTRLILVLGGFFETYQYGTRLVMQEEEGGTNP